MVGHLHPCTLGGETIQGIVLPRKHCSRVAHTAQIHIGHGGTGHLGSERRKCFVVCTVNAAFGAYPRIVSGALVKSAEHSSRIGDIAVLCGGVRVVVARIIKVIACGIAAHTAPPQGSTAGAHTVDISLIGTVATIVAHNAHIVHKSVAYQHIGALEEEGHIISRVRTQFRGGEFIFVPSVVHFGNRDQRHKRRSVGEVGHHSCPQTGVEQIDWPNIDSKLQTCLECDFYFVAGQRHQRSGNHIAARSRKE